MDEARALMSSGQQTATLSAAGLRIPEHESTLLVVDDDPVVISLIDRMLRGHGFRIVRCSRPEDAVGLALQTSPDLVLLDINMPGIDGFTVARALRDQAGLAHTPLLFISARDDTDDKARAFAAGGVDYLTKPFGERELLVRVRTHLASYRTRKLLEEQEQVLRRELGRTSARVHASQRNLESRNALLSALLATLPDLVFLKDADGVYLDCNPPVAKLLGRPVEAIIGRTDAELFPPEVATKLLRNDRKALEVGGPHTYEEWLRYPDGHVALFETTKSPMYDRDGELLGVVGIAHDVTDRDRVRRQLERSKAELLEAQRVAGVGSWNLDLTTGALAWSPETYRLFGVAEGEPVSFELFAARIHPEDRRMVLDAWDGAVRNGAFQVDHRILHEGRVRWVREQARFETDAEGVTVRATGTVLDITQRREQEQELEAEQARLNAALEAAQAGTFEWDLATDTLHFTDRWAQLLGHRAQDLDPSPRAWQERIHPDDRPEMMLQLSRVLSGQATRLETEYRSRHRDGTWVWLRTLGRVVRRDDRGEPTSFVGIDLNITEQRTHQEQLDFVAHHDGLTGLFNRPRFIQQLDEELAACVLEERGLALLCLDLDGFDQVNREHSRAAGNQLLVELANRLLEVVGDRRLVARIGGDEFAVILHDVVDIEALRGAVAALQDSVARPLVLQGRALAVTTSVGVTLFPQGRDVDADQLLRQADQATYQAKLAGKNRSHLFDAEHELHSRRRFQQLDTIRAALIAGEFVLHYQPKVNLRTGEVRGFEALIRWQHPQRGLLSPIEFIPLVAGHPLAIEVGDWVIAEALAQLVRWRDQGLVTAVSVNVDSVQLHDPAFVERLEQLLAAQPTVDVSQLELEILETGAMEDLDRVSALVRRLQNMGLKVALDDFGTGYASLTFLKRLTADTVKIDRSFVRNLLVDPEHVVIVDSIVGLSRRFEREVLAEGVESDEHGRLLLELGCELAQGYSIAKPMPADDAPAWVASWRPPAVWATTPPVTPDRVPDVLMEVEHRAWRDWLCAYLEGTVELPPQLDHERCRLGRWLVERSEHLSDVDRPFAEEIAYHHRALHGAAVQAAAVRDLPDDGGCLPALCERAEQHSTALIGALRSWRHAED